MKTGFSLWDSTTVGIGSQGVPCELYRVWVCSVGTGIFFTLFLLGTFLARLSSGNLSSNSSLLPMFECYSPDRNWIHISSIHSKIESHLMTKIFLCQGKFNLTRSFSIYYIGYQICTVYKLSSLL